MAGLVDSEGCSAVDVGLAEGHLEPEVGTTSHEPSSRSVELKSLCIIVAIGFCANL